MTFRLKKVVSLMVCISLMISSVSALSEKQKDWFELMENEYLGKGIAVDQDGC